MVETRGRRRFAIFFVLAAFLILFLGRWIKPVNNVALTVVSPFAAVVNGAATGVGDAVSGVLDSGRLRRENAALQKENAKLVRRVIEATAEHHDIAILRSMVKFQDSNSHMDLLPCRVIWFDPSGTGSSYVVINKGARDGLRQGMTVLDQNGYLVGSVADTWTNGAKVLLLINPSSSIGTVDLVTRARGLVEGRFSAMPQFRYVVTGDKLRLNDLVVTSGQLDLYPRNLLVGQIVSVSQHTDQVFQTADVRPAADFQHLEVVQIVRNWVRSAPAQLAGSH